MREISVAEVLLYVSASNLSTPDLDWYKITVRRGSDPQTV